jgi:hypothetical protein
MNYPKLFNKLKSNSFLPPDELKLGIIFHDFNYVKFVVTTKNHSGMWFNCSYEDI